MHAYRLPSACITEIEKLCAAFLWSGPELNSKKAKIAWTDLCVPINEGGLGLRNLMKANQATVLKLVWRLLSAKDSLWVNWIQQHLIRDSSFWSLPTTSAGSWMWEKMLKIRDIALTFFKKEARNGDSTSFWFDNWSSMGILIHLTGPRGYIDLGIPAHATIKQALLTHNRRRHRVEVLNKIEDELDFVRQKHSPLADVPLWRIRDDVFKQRFSISCTYHQLRHPKPQVEWSKAVWFSHHTPKFAFISWLGIHDRLSTGNRLLSWNPQGSTVCVFCCFPIETRNHLFFDCPFSENVWSALSSGLFQGNYSLDWDTVLIQLLHPGLDKVQSFLRRYLFQTVVYHIWRERNARKHGKLPTTSAALVQMVERTMRSRLTSIRMLGDAQYESGMQAWFDSTL